VDRLYADQGDYTVAQATFERCLDRARRRRYRYEEAEAVDGLSAFPARVS
jgi:hypothetical protein